MSVLDRAALEESPLADLHALASELSIDGYRRLRRGDLIDAILARQGGGEPAAATEPAADDEHGEAMVDVEAVVAEEADRGAVADVEEAAVEEGAVDEEADRGAAAGVEEGAVEEGEEAEEDEDEKPSGRRRRGRRGGRGRSVPRGESAATAEQEPDAIEEPEPEPEAEEEEEEEEEASIEGVVELLANGSGFLRVSPPDPSDDDVYISAAQVKRCELVSGDRVAGPRRAPRRSERFASLVRIDTINGRPAAELISGVRFEDLPAAFADERLALDSLDPTLNAIDAQTPFGKGSRVTIVGGSRAGKTEALRRLASTLGAREDIQLSIALAGVRPEEITEWRAGPIEPAAALSFAASSDAQDHAVELVIDQARRIAARGAHALVLIDTLDGLHPHAARKALASARKILDGGSLTVIATASEQLGGETTVIALDARLAAAGQFPALDIMASGTLRPELLVGEDGAQTILAARRAGVAR
jgi:transcription termination factor Rho